MEQHWELLAPFPPFDGWFVLEADTANLPPGTKTQTDPTAQPGYYPRYRVKMLLATTLFHQNDAIKAQICRAIAHNQKVKASQQKLSFWGPIVDQNGIKVRSAGNLGRSNPREHSSLGREEPIQMRPNIWTLDLRSLACLRIALALMVLLDLYVRQLDLSLFYTDQGLLPRSAFPGNKALEIGINFHMCGGEEPPPGHGDSGPLS